MLPFDDFIRIAKALSDARRFAILERIASDGDAACQRLCEMFPVSQPTMSHHLRLLAEVGLIETRRDGQYVYYQLRADVMRAYLDTLEARTGLTRARARAERSPRRARRG